MSNEERLKAISASVTEEISKINSTDNELIALQRERLQFEMEQARRNDERVASNQELILRLLEHFIKK